MRRIGRSVAALAALAVLAHAPAAAAPPGGIDVLVNDPAGDVPESTTQSETTLAVLGSTVCAGFVDGGVSGFARSDDHGDTWTDQGFLPGFTDPVLAVHARSATFYHARITFLLGAGVTIGVAHSADACRSFSDPVTATPGSLGPHLHDKPWIAIDNSGGPEDGSVYVCWTRFLDSLGGPASSGEIRFSRSADGGRTFGADQALSEATDFFPFGCHVAVGPQGEVYVTWSDRTSDFPIRFRRSLDGGSTWDPVVQVNRDPIRHPGWDRQRQCEPDNWRPTLNGDIRMLAQTWMAADTTGGPYRGHLYVVWAHDPPGETDNSDVFFSRSTDGGLTWAAETQLGGGTETDQFEPFVAVGGFGAVAVAWYDRRNDPEENLAIDVYTAVSRDGGRTFDPIQRLTDVSFPVPPITGQPTGSGNFDPFRPACYMGEYIAIAADARTFFYAWGDNRHTVVSAAYPEGRPDPDVFFDRRRAPDLGPGDANCDRSVTAADLPRLLALVAAGSRAACGFDDADESGGLDAVDVEIALAALFWPP